MPAYGRWGGRRPRRDSPSGWNRSTAAGWWPQLRDFQLRKLRPQRLLPHRTESHYELGVVVERLDAEYRTLAELRMTHAHAGAEARRHGLVLVLVGVGGLLLADAPPSPAVRIGPELRERRLVGRDEGGRDFLDQFAGNFIDE